MTLEDPRQRYRQLQNERVSTESIPLQPVHGSPYHVYPTSNYPAVQAFQAPVTGLQSMSASPLLQAKLQQQMVDYSPILRHGSYGSPNTPRSVSRLAKQNIQETSFMTQADTDAAVAKINTMFPTASETHIRLLLKKYLKSVFPKADETLLLDILANSENNVQIASEKLISMGYTKRDTSAPRLSNRHHAEEKRDQERRDAEKLIPLKLKIKTTEDKNKIKANLQQQYGGVAERIITMALESVDFSEDKAGQILEIVLREEGDKQTVNDSEKTTAADDTISIAQEANECDDTLDGGRRDEAPAKPQSDQTRKPTEANGSSSPSSSSSSSPSSQAARPIVTTPDTGSKSKFVRAKARQEHAKSINQEVISNGVKLSNFQSVIERTQASGHNAEMVKGPNDELLLVDYVTWNGANPDLVTGLKCHAKGGDALARSSTVERSYAPHGANQELCKGPQGIAKGSIYNKINNRMPANVKCN